MADDVGTMGQNTAALEHSLNLHAHFDKVKEFYEAIEVPMKDEMDLTCEQTKQMVLGFYMKAYQELKTAFDSRNEEMVVAALARNFYNLKGCCQILGISPDLLERALEVRHRSNMSKLGPEGKFLGFDSDGKVLKGPNYIPEVYTHLIQPTPQGRQTGETKE